VDFIKFEFHTLQFPFEPGLFLAFILVSLFFRWFLSPPPLAFLFRQEVLISRVFFFCSCMSFVTVVPFQVTPKCCFSSGLFFLWFCL